MSSYTAPTRTQSIFNPSNFTSSSTSSSSYLTASKGDSRYLQLTGGTETGSVSFNAGLKTDTISVNSTTTNATLALPKISGGDTTTSTLSINSLTVGDNITASSGNWRINDSGANFNNGITCQSGTVYANKIQGTSFQSTGSYFTFDSPVGDKQLKLYSPLNAVRTGVIQALVGSASIPSGGSGTSPVSINIASYANNKSCIIIGVVGYYWPFTNSANPAFFAQLTAPITTTYPTTTNTSTGLNYLTLGVLNFNCVYTPYVQYAGSYYGGVQNITGTTINNGLRVQANGSSILIYAPAITSPNYISVSSTVFYSLYLLNEGGSN